MAQVGMDSTAPVGAPGAEAPAAPAPLLADPRVHAAGFALVALIPRLVYLFQIRPWPFYLYPVLDAGSQVLWARTVLQTPLWMGTDALLAKAPAYTYFLASTMWFAGSGDSGLAAAHVLQLALGALTCGLVYLIGRKAFGPTAGAIGAALFACFGPEIFNEGELLDTALTTFLSACVLLALLHALERPTVGRWLGVGLLLGLAGVSRPNLLLLAVTFLVLIFAWIRQGREKEEVRGITLAFVGGLALAILPATARNALTAGEFIPIATNGGINFYTGNSPKADGFSPIPAGLEWERSWYEWKALGRLTAKQQDGFYRGRALQFWREQPGKALALLVKKCYLYWNGYDIPNNLSFQWGRAHASVLRVLIGFEVVGPLGLLGLLLGARRSREAKALALAIATLMVSVVLVFVNGRYRSPMLPALMPFAGLAVVEVGRALKARQTRVLAVSAVGLVVAVLLVNSDVYGVRATHGGAANRDSFYLGQCYQTRQDPAASREAFRQVTVDRPADPDGWNFLAQMEMQTGETQAAAEHFRKALELAPDYARAAAALAELSVSQGWPLAEPKRLLLRALSTQKDSLHAALALFRVDMRLGDRAAAQQDLGRVVEVFSHYNPSGKEYPYLASQVQAISAEATAAGVVLPEQLQPSQSAQPRMDMGGQ